MEESVQSIVCEMRREFDKSWWDVDREWAHDLADRLEAAHERECLALAEHSLRCGDCARFGHDCDAGDVDGREDCLPCERFVRAVAFKTDTATGNAARMRVALIRVLDWLKRMNAQPLNSLAVSELTPSYAVNRTAKSIIEDNDYHISQLTAALAAPPRNCDVGTPREQQERRNLYCITHDSCGDCPASPRRASNENVACVFTWAQMPFKKRGAAE